MIDRALTDDEELALAFDEAIRLIDEPLADLVELRRRRFNLALYWKSRDERVGRG